MDDEPELSASKEGVLGELLAALKSPPTPGERWELTIRFALYFGDFLELRWARIRRGCRPFGDRFTSEERASIVSAVKRSSSLEVLSIWVRG